MSILRWVGLSSLLALTACGAGKGGFNLGSGGLKASATGSAKLPDLKLGEVTAASAANDAASQALPAIAKLDILGTRVSKSFHKDGIVHVVVIARDASGKAILDSKVFVEVHAKASVPFPMKETVKVAGVRQPTGAQPFQLALDIDSSGSMSSSDKNRSRVPAAKKFIDLVNQDFPRSEFAVLDFDDKIRTLAPLPSDPTAAKNAVDKVKEGGSTALHPSAIAALDALKAGKKPGYQQGLLVLTDGQDNNDKHVTTEQVVARAKADGVPIYALALAGGLDVPGLSFVGDVQEYAAQTGGVFAYAKDAGSLQRAFEVMATGATRGNTDIEINLSGGTYVPFSKLTFDVTVRSGKATATDSFEFIVPLGG